MPISSFTIITTTTIAIAAKSQTPQNRTQQEALRPMIGRTMPASQVVCKLGSWQTLQRKSWIRQGDEEEEEEEEGPPAQHSSGLATDESETEAQCFLVEHHYGNTEQDS
nr:hypothetical protein BaRGS_032092 [Batillaria attramentaria]